MASKDTEKSKQPVVRFRMDRVTYIGDLFAKMGKAVVLKKRISKKAIPVNGWYETDDPDEIEYLKRYQGFHEDEDTGEKTPISEFEEIGDFSAPFKKALAARKEVESKGGPVRWRDVLAAVDAAVRA